MKKFIVTLFLIGIITTSYAQTSSNRISDNRLSVGADLYGYGNGLKLTYDHYINDLFTIGLGTTFYFNEIGDDFFVYGRGTLRLNTLLDLPKEFDIYPGVELGYLAPAGVGITGFIGFSYMFTPKISGFIELGNNGALGVSINL